MEPAPPQLRKLGPEDLARIVEAHGAWVKSEGARGQAADLRYAELIGATLRGVNLSKAALTGAVLTGADLRGANLRKADLAGAVLAKADLTGACLAKSDLRGADLGEARVRRADLYRADLREADLAGANLQGADIVRADLQQAQLRRANLRDCNLQDAVLTGCHGLLVGQLGGANLSGARLPDDVKFEGLGNVAEASKMTQNLFTTILLACAYAWLTIASTTDAQLLNNAAPPSSRLPVLGADIPLVRFYAVVPMLLLGLYVYFHLGLQRLWEELAELPAVFPDGRPLDKKAYPWLLNVLVRAHATRLRENRSHLSRWQARMSVLLAWGLVPLTLLVVWARYLRGHDWFITALHIVLVSAAIGAGSGFLRLAASTLQGSEKRAFLWKKAWKHARTNSALIFVGLIAGFTLLSFGAIEGTDAELTHQGITERDHYALGGFDPRHWVPHLFQLAGYRPFAHLEDVHLSTTPPNWAAKKPEHASTEKNEYRVELVDRDYDEVKGADLEHRNLRYASAYNAFLVCSYMKEADLRHSDLRESDLRKADLRRALLTGTNFREADLRGADLKGASGIGVRFREAYLGEAELDWAFLREADFREADLWKADLSGADLTRADLRGAKLEQTTIAPHDGAPPTRLVEANLQGLDLQHADLSGVNLHGADLRGAKLAGAVLCGADLTGADLTGATGLQAAQVAPAIVDATTQLPAGLSALARKGGDVRR
jgi:uncharacterized protein YjbI with pentapeptide repeats